MLHAEHLHYMLPCCPFLPGCQDSAGVACFLMRASGNYLMCCLHMLPYNVKKIIPVWQVGITPLPHDMALIADTL